MDLTFGLRDMPNVKAAWGARMIFPNDLVPDRTSMIGDEAGKAALLDWLNRCAPAPGGEAFNATVRSNTSPSDSHVFTIYEDETGVVRASAQGSCGYLYVSAWRKDAVL